MRRFKRERVDVILMSNFTEKLFVTILSLFFKIPVVWIEYGKLESVLKRNLGIPKIIYRFTGKIPYAVIVPTVFTKESLIKDAHISPAKIQTIPLGVDVPKKLIPSLSKNSFIIGSVSRLTSEKGQEYLIKAMPEILRKIPNAKLLIVGRGPDRKYFENIARDLNIQDHVEFMGFVENLNNQYSRMNVFVFPTVWDMEGFGLVIPEAMLRKIPVLASAKEPITALVQDGQTAILFEPGNPTAIAESVIKIYKNPEIAKKITDNAYKFALQNYTIEGSSVKIKNILYEASIS